MVEQDYEYWKKVEAEKLEEMAKYQRLAEWQWKRYDEAMGDLERYLREAREALERARIKGDS